ncbi:MAG: hypothetical protein AAF517_01980 [Planctomycetota bacterium]
MRVRSLLTAAIPIVTVLGLSLKCLIEDREIWPFSNYPMYSYVQKDRFRYVQIYGVPRAGGDEVSLNSRDFWDPFSPVELHGALARLKGLPDRGGRLREALHYLVSRYEFHRSAGRHGEPDLSFLRIYESRWDLSRFDPAASAPERRLLAEYRLEGGEG